MTTPVPNHSAFVTFSAAENTAFSAPSLGDNNRKRQVSGNMVTSVDLASRHMPKDVSGQPYWDAGHLPQKRRCRQSRNTARSGAFTSTERTPTAPSGGPGAIMLQSPSRPLAVANPQLMEVDPVKDPFPSLLAESRSERRQSLTVDLAPCSSEILSRFTATHQHQIKKNVHHPGVKTVLSNTRMLLKTLEDRHIQLSMNRAKPPVPTLFSMLERFDIVKDHPICSKYFHKAHVFFSATGQTINNTGCLTSMLKSKESITRFTNMDDENVALIAGNSFLKQVSSMCSNKGIPEEANVKAFLNLPCLKEGWQGDDEAVKDQPLDRALVIHISSMCSGKGLPKEADVKGFLKLPCLKEGWQGNDEVVKDQPLDRALVTHISSMCNGKGLPKESDIKVFLNLPCLKEGWQGNDEAVNAQSIDRILVTHISSICHGRGFPKAADVEAFLKLPCLKEGWQGDDEVVKDQPLNRALVTHISSMCSSKGLPLPKEAELKAFLKQPCLKEGWQGNDEAVKDRPLDQSLVTHISSICHGRGLPKAADVEAFLKLPCLKEGWQGDDEVVKDQPLNRALVTHISSMCSGKGLPLPKEADVKAFLKLSCLKEGWQGNDEAVQDQPLDLAMVTHISSMCHAKGLPKAADVKTFLQIPCLKEGWQGDDEVVKDQPLNRALVTNISSMFNCKGLPKGADVKAFLKQPCLKEGWQGNDEVVKDQSLDGGLVTNISSMCCKKGLPKAADVKAFLKLPCLKEGWQDNDEAVKDQPLDRELVTHISSMCNGKGLPKAADVKAFLKLPCLKEGWQDNDEVVKDQPLDRELVTHISSMCNGKGLPKAADVKAFLKLPCLKEGWQDNDEVVKDQPLDRELVTHISSMCNGKGFPKAADVKAFLKLPCLKEGWQDNDEAVKDQPLHRELVTHISSMCSGKGLPKAADVKAFLKLPCLKEGWQDNDEAVKDQPLDRELVTRISSMCNGKGLPKAADVKAFLKLPCLKEGWQGNDEAVKNQALDRTLVTHISSMCDGKGLPKEADVKAFVNWLSSDERRGLLKLACRVYACSGLPKQASLADHEERLRHCLKGDHYSTDSDMDDDLPIASHMKALALFCAAPEKRRMKLTEFKRYLAAHNSARNERTVVHAVLASLLSMLANHGGPGVRLWLEMHDQNPRCKKMLTQALSIPAPLGRTKFALTQLPESQWQEYLELCKHLKPAPNPAQWMALQPLCELLNRRFPFTFAKRMMLEILWPQSEDNRLKYANKMDCLFKAVPTVSQLHRLHRALGPKKMHDFLDACLTWQNSKGIVPEVKVQERLLEGLLVAHHYLPECEAIPDLCFSKCVSVDNERGVIIDGDYAMRGQERLWYFIVAMLMELQQTEYQFKKPRLKVCPREGEPVVLPKPEFTPTDTGFVINNWSLEQLTAFFKATEFHEQWSKKPDNHGALGTIRGEEKLAPIDTTVFHHPYQEYTDS